MNADVMAGLSYFDDQPKPCENGCSSWHCDDETCRVHLAVCELDHTAVVVSDSIKAMRHITRPARKELAEYTGDGLSNAACEYGADFDTKKFVRDCGVKQLAEARS